MRVAISVTDGARVEPGRAMVEALTKKGDDNARERTPART